MLATNERPHGAPGASYNTRPYLDSHVNRPGFPLAGEPQEDHRRVGLGDRQGQAERVPLQRRAGAVFVSFRRGIRSKQTRVAVVFGVRFAWDDTQKKNPTGGRRREEGGELDVRVLVCILSRRDASTWCLCDRVYAAAPLLLKDRCNERQHRSPGKSPHQIQQWL